MEEVRKLHQEKAELEKENDFLKKSSGILCEGNRLEAYRFIDNYKEDFGLRWLFLHMNIHPNTYYNYLKKTKTNYHRQKKAILNTIRDIYHECNGKK